MKYVRIYGLLALWLVFFALMVRDHFLDPFDPSLEGTAAYGHNSDGSLQQMGLLGLVELAVLYVIVWPFQPVHPARVAIALGVLVPWALLSTVFTMHAGGIVAWHALWTWAVLLALVIALPVSFVLGRQRASEQAPDPS